MIIYLNVFLIDIRAILTWCLLFVSNMGYFLILTIPDYSKAVLRYRPLDLDCNMFHRLDNSMFQCCAIKCQLSIALPGFLATGRKDLLFTRY